ncbi:chain length determinant protein EpsF [Azoarcus sp. DD4]|uniref:chain length determinant protein EpsF n=1 Tax=Azoarcus sp. DD4 TaxID=2027405 RepID=UPI00112EDB1C|nr:chain length determinant protein EpsF [Azoarcus sp. DD4]QDF97611.1 chain length determinant protein EpsF [Azoarcus sp. DD4]
MTIQQLFLILRAHLRLIGGVLAGVVVVTMLASLMLPRKYTAQTAVVVDVRGTDPIQGAAMQGAVIPGYLATQVDIIASERVARRVVALLKLDRNVDLQARWQGDTGGSGSFDDWLVRMLAAGLTVKPSRESSVLAIGYTGADPAFAAMVANAFAQAYIDTSLELKVEPARQYSQWFNDRNKSLRDDLEAAQRKLSDYQQANGVILSDDRLDVESARLAELSSQLVNVQAQRADSRSRQSQSGSADTMPEVLQNGLIQNLKADIARLEAQRGQTLGRLGPNHPEIARIDAELGSLRQRVAGEIARVASSLGTAARISNAREAEVAAAVAAQKQKVLELKAHHDRISVLRRDVESAQRAYDLVAQRLAETSLESQTRLTNVVVLSPAVEPASPSSPKLALNAVLAVVLGTLLGIGAALVKELRNPRVRAAGELAQLLGVPVIAVLPPRPALVRDGRRRLLQAPAR